MRANSPTISLSAVTLLLGLLVLPGQHHSSGRIFPRPEALPPVPEFLVSVAQTEPILHPPSPSTPRITVVHIGDSHIQAGYISNRIREELFRLFQEPILSFGYTFPYTVCNTHPCGKYRYSATGKWNYRSIISERTAIYAGMAGYELSTTDPSATLTVTAKKNTDPIKFNRITILFNADNAALIPSISIATDSYTDREKGIACYTLPSLQNSATITLKPGSNHSPGALTISGIILEQTHSKIAYHAAGINGATVRSYLRADNLSNELRILKPEIVIVSLGTNDAYNTGLNAKTFRNNLDSLIRRIKTAAPRATILLTTAGDHFIKQKYPNKHIATVNRIIKEEARTCNTLLWDFHRLMGGEGSMKRWNNADLTAKDMIHLNKKGYDIKGLMLALYLAYGIHYQVNI